jgi:hypothetical protein
MKHRRLVLAALAIVAAAACTPYPPDEGRGGSNNCTGFCGDLNNFFGNGPTASPSPGPGSGTITRVAVVSFGEGSCTGSAQPISEPATVRVGCVEDVTCTPKMAGPDGSEIMAPPSVHGPAPTSFEIVSGGSFASFEQSELEAFNGRLRGRAPGTAVLSCLVKGVRGEKAFTIVQ